ncbi:primosomal protein [Microbacterium sp. zg-B96]|uniref:primosomal protein n=1 Tax=Microbacterium sp. zg-B96 TaxID=3049069 RepID=UPI00254EE817|nr:primosomal protein [Microbacterium sp. zg-B96]WIM16997.1 primosomal protein [Microbacterium sp. zg-B96]
MKRDGDRKPYTPREGGDRKPYTPREGGDRKPYTPREGGDRKPYTPREGGDRKPYTPGGDRKPYVKRDGDRKPYTPRDGGDRKPYTPRDGGDRKPYSPRDGGDRKPYTPRDGGDRKPYTPRDGGDRKPYTPRDGGDRKPYTPREGGDRKPYSPRDGGDRKPYAKRDGGGRPFDSRDDGRTSRPPQEQREAGPQIPDEVTARDLHPSARNELKTLSKENAEQVGRHLAMAAQLIDDDPQLAHEHALAAVRRAGRIAVARETAAITAYAIGDFALALRELRTYRRISGRDDQIALMVDSERGVGRPDRALEVGRAVDRATLPTPARVELAIAMSGARLDLGEPERALSELDIPELDPDRAFEWSPALFSARATVLEELGRTDEAAEWQRRAVVAAEAIDASLGLTGDDEFQVVDEVEEIAIDDEPVEVAEAPAAVEADSEPEQAVAAEPEPEPESTTDAEPKKAKKKAKNEAKAQAKESKKKDKAKAKAKKDKKDKKSKKDKKADTATAATSEDSDK